jgi:ATP-dependent DNA helicase DinG
MSAFENLPEPPAPDIAGGRRVAPPDASALVATTKGAVIVSADGEIDLIAPDALARRLSAGAVMVCHSRACFRRLNIAGPQAGLGILDVLELFAFTRPARFVLPTERGLAEALGLEIPRTAEDRALVILRVADLLLEELVALDGLNAAYARRTALAMTRAGWGWGTAVLIALGMPERMDTPRAGLDIWNRLPDIEERAAPNPPGTEPVSPDAARQRLAELVGTDSESRPAQYDFAATAAQAFAPRDEAGIAHVVLAEAGTGIGKTLGYVAPASLWAEINKGPVWISTYTKNLQRQIDRELERLYPDPADKARHTVIRKGRENYLCLLNFEEAVARGGIGLGLVARWALASRDGDMIGGDLPAWLGPIVPQGLTDRRGECIHAACPHVRKCFIEKSVRKSRRARLVVANHALVMVQAALEHGLSGEQSRPKPANDSSAPSGETSEDGQGLSGDVVNRVVFDEGHQIFDAADSAFSAHLSAAEGFDLRRWVRGAEAERRGRVRGLRERIGDLVAGHDALSEALDHAVSAAALLPGDGFIERLAGTPKGPLEQLFKLIRAQVLARAPQAESGHDLEAPIDPPLAGLVDAATAAGSALSRLAVALAGLSSGLRARLDDEAATLDTNTRLRIEAVCRGLDRRGRLLLPAWIGMLAAIDATREGHFVDWFGIERSEGREVDVGLHRHWLDPTIPFARAVMAPAHGVLVTSATLRDRGPNDPDDWRSAEVRTGGQHLIVPPRRASFASPFDYENRTQVLIVTDVRRDAPDEVAAAYRELFKASGGGALGLFTAIRRLKMVHQRIVAPLEADGLTLFAQHVDPIDTGTLVDMFRAETDSCLLGTDAVRDGVDVPGRSLRLIVFDRVPWPAPNLLHKARREAFGGPAYDDMIVRLKLKQAFGRLLRKADDRGVFVMLDAMLPSRLLTAFPPGVNVSRLGLVEALDRTRKFL